MVVGLGNLKDFSIILTCALMKLQLVGEVCYFTNAQERLGVAPQDCTANSTLG